MNRLLFALLWAAATGGLIVGVSALVVGMSYVEERFGERGLIVFCALLILAVGFCVGWFGYRP